MQESFEFETLRFFIALSTLECSPHLQLLESILSSSFGRSLKGSFLPFFLEIFRIELPGLSIGFILLMIIHESGHLWLSETVVIFGYR